MDPNIIEEAPDAWMALSALAHLVTTVADYLRLCENVYDCTPDFPDIGDAYYVIDQASIPTLKMMLATAVRLQAERVCLASMEGARS